MALPAAVARSIGSERESVEVAISTASIATSFRIASAVRAPAPYCAASLAFADVASMSGTATAVAPGWVDVAVAWTPAIACKRVTLAS